MPAADDPNGEHAGGDDVDQVDDRARAESDSKRVQRQWLPRLRPVGRWTAGVLATVTATAIIGWLLAWGILPDGQATAPTVETAPSTPSDSGVPQPSSTPDNEPFTVAVIPIARTTIGWILPLSPEEAPQRPAADEIWDGWVEQTQAVSINSHTVLFTVQGTSEAQVTLTDMRIDVTERRPPIRGYKYGATGGGTGSIRYVVADLDGEPPSMSDVYEETFAESLPRHERHPIRFPYYVAITDAETFAVVAETDDCHCFFVIELTWTSQGRTGTYTVDDNGEPFQVSGSSELLGTCTVYPDLPEECD